MRISISKSKAMVLDGKRWFVLAKLKNSPREGVQASWGLFMNEGRMECVIKICSNVVNIPVCCSEEGTELKGEALDLPVNVFYYSYPWSWTLSHD